MPETTVVFSGSFDDCLAAYAKKIELTYSKSNRVQALAQFTEAPDNSVYRWLSGSRAVTGERRLRTMYFLEAQHYEVFELRALPEVVWQAGWLIANRKIGLVAVGVHAGYSISRFLRLFREGVDNMHPAKKEALVHLVAVFKDVVPSRSQSTLDASPPMLTPKERDEILNRDTTGAPVKKNLLPAAKEIRRDTTILSHLIQAALPLAERMNSNECTEADRQFLRQLTKEGWQDGATLFRLANALNGLCSQKARELQQNKKG